MKFQKILIKTAYYLVGISIIVLIALTVYQQYLIKKQLENPAETLIEPESTDDSASEPGEIPREGSTEITESFEEENYSPSGMPDNYDYKPRTEIKKTETDETENIEYEADESKTYPGDIFQSE